MKVSSIKIFLHNDLHKLLRGKDRHKDILYPLTRRATIKDIIESLGVPHTEIGKVEGNGVEKTFQYIPTDGDIVHVFPFSHESIPSLSNLLWLETWELNKFMVDINVLRLARNMRLVGFDTTVVPDLSLSKVAIQASREKRVILTRNRDLLKCRNVIFGQLLRSENHIVQLQEVTLRFRLKHLFSPFSRCLRCNTILQDVSKNEIEMFLEPLTRKYFNNFKRCDSCKKIYWQGSHHHNIKKMLAEIEF